MDLDPENTLIHPCTALTLRAVTDHSALPVARELLLWSADPWGLPIAGQDPSALLTFPSDFLGQIEQQDLRVHDSCELQRLFAGNRRAVTGL
jgi:hypothetical protein